MKIGLQNTKKLSRATREDDPTNGVWTRQRRRWAHRQKMLAGTPRVVETFDAVRVEKVRVQIARADRRVIAAMAVHATHARDLAHVVARETVDAGGAKGRAA